METLIYLDTHVVVWLYANEFKKFPANTLKLIENNPVRIAPIVLLELGYLYEIGRLQDTHQTIIEVLKQTLELKICDLAYLQVIESAIEVTWTRDPFDRLIVAQATVNQSTLVTKDTIIRSHYPYAIWEAK